MKPLYKILISIAGALVLALFVLLTINALQNSYSSKVGKAISYMKTGQTIRAGQPIVTSMRRLNRYVTATYYEEVLLNEEKTRLLGKDQLVMIYHVTVEAGFDLTHLADESVATPTDTTVILTLPHAVILPGRSKPSDKEVFKDSDKWSFEEENQLHQKALSIAQQNARDEGLIGKAETNCRKYMTQLLMALGYKEHNVTIKFN